MDSFVIIGISIVVIFFIIFIALIIRGSSQNNLEKTLTKMGDAMIKAQNNIINNNEEILKETSDKTADIHKDAVKTIAHSIKEGLSDEDIIYCKHCGAQIDADSTFCKKCGKPL